MLQIFLLKEHLKGKWTLKGHSRDTIMALQGHSKGTLALAHLKGTRALEGCGHLGTQALEALGYSKGTWALRHSRHLGTKALGHSGTRRSFGHSWYFT